MYMRLFFNKVACSGAAALMIAALATCAFGQQPTPDAAPAANPTPAADSAPAAVQSPAPDAAKPIVAPGTPAAETVEPIDKRILGVLPNYRTVQDTGHVEPITAKRKLWIASKDSFDYPIWFLAAVFAGYYQLLNSNPEFGQGLKGYFHRYGTAFVDQSFGNMMTEGFMPCLLHEDPRYFRSGVGPKWHRAWYAATRVFVTHTDAGTTRFNYSEWLGNSIAVAFSNAYYPATRDVGDNVEKLILQVGTDSASNVLKEFWPDVKRKLHHHAATAQAQ
jgi:hypothetical protein